jgi:hypothetical protein
MCRYVSVCVQYMQVSWGMAAPALKIESPWGVQDRVHLLVAPHGSHGIFSVPHRERKRALQCDEKGLSHVSQVGHIIVIRLWRPSQVVPVQPLVDSHYHARERVSNAGATSCVVLGDGLGCQAIKQVREKEHELLHIASINNGGLLFPRRLGEGLKEGHNGLMSEPHEGGVLGSQTAAQVVQARRQDIHDRILWQAQVNYELLDCFHDDLTSKSFFSKKYTHFF